MLSKVLKEKIMEKGISTHALEKKAGLKPSAIQNILYGRSKNPSIHIIQAVAQALGCRVSELIEENTSSSDESYFTKTNHWNQELYLACFSKVHQLLQQEKKLLTREKIHEIVEEIYFYSASNDLKEPDHLFCAWIIKKLV
jgi:transcriptional regulator with XRE-family HTH domain